MDITREQVVQELGALDLEWGDEEDAVSLVDLLLEVHTTVGAWTWLTFWCDDLDGTPLDLVGEGHSREVFKAARRAVEAYSRVQA